MSVIEGIVYLMLAATLGSSIASNNNSDATQKTKFCLICSEVETTTKQPEIEIKRQTTEPTGEDK